MSDAAEQAHFNEVVASFLNYRVSGMSELAGYAGSVLKNTPKQDLKNVGFDPNRWVDEVAGAIIVNQEVLELTVSAYLGDIPDPLYTLPVESRNASKARTTLKQFAREWSEQGREERETAFLPILDALTQYLPVEPGNRPKVLCPGSGLSRLPYEICRRGFDCQGNEFSYHMIIASNLVLNAGISKDSLTIFPAVHARGNRLEAETALKSVSFPDAAPAEEPGLAGELSLAAGEFSEVYGNSKSEWDGIATCFFLDTAKNICQYIRLFAQLLRPGGVWTNCGPLLYHFAENLDDISVELSWDEVKGLMGRYFEIREERFIDCKYTCLEGMMSSTVYTCIFFIAVRNSDDVWGSSYRVYL